MESAACWRPGAGVKPAPAAEIKTKEAAPGSVVAGDDGTI